MGYPFHKKLLTSAVANNYSFALCKLPRNPQIKTFISSELPVEETVKSRINRCFVFSSFNNGHKAVMLKPEVYFEDEKLTGTDETSNAYLRLMNNRNYGNSQHAYFPSVKENRYCKKDDYLALVNKAVDAINEKQFQKLVIARCAEAELTNNFDPLIYFYKLCEAYNNAFVYFFSSPEHGTWVGATPEKLVTVEENILQTVALAGTLDKKSLTDWSKKEREEQAYVEKYISGVFATIGISDYRRGSVQTIAAGNLRHLQTTFSWQTDPENIQKYFAAFLKELNPTPAVCGLPKLEAAEFIYENENFERRFYSGFAGIIDHHSAHLFVNIRCLELLNEKAILYAGAGVTANSDAEKEWIETEKKMQATGSYL